MIDREDFNSRLQATLSMIAVSIFAGIFICLMYALMFRAWWGYWPPWS